MVFAVKIVFSKRKIPKISRLRRGYTPSNPQKIGACGATTAQAIIQNNDVQKVIIQKVIIQNIDVVQKGNHSKK